jgi:acyl-CoA-dependent ceramide synthase
LLNFGQTSKTLHYINSRFTAPYFVFFIGTWIYLRHYLNLRILWSEFNEFKRVGPYVLNWEEEEQYKCELSHWISTILLGGLQALNLFWGVLILRVAWRFGVKGELGDSRSEDEGEEVEERILLGRERESVGEKSSAAGNRRAGMPKRRAR